MQYNFNQVSLLITHYNRSTSLERLLKSFKEMDISFAQIVVSDDGSKPVHHQKLIALKNQYSFDLVDASENKGLGNNINKGQDAVTQPFTLYVQEDFVPKSGFIENFNHALQVFNKNHDLDLIRFYAYFKYPYVKKFDAKLSEMKFSNSILKANHLKFYVYSDHPHLRRSTFLEKFGRYPEGIKGDDTEFAMCLSFLKNGGKALIMKDFKAMFEQMNFSNEPSTMQRENWKQQDKALIKALRKGYLKYRLLKNSVQLITFKPKTPSRFRSA